MSRGCRHWAGRQVLLSLLYWSGKEWDALMNAPDIRHANWVMVPCERVYCIKIHNTFEAKESTNRLSNDKLKQQINRVEGSTEPISCKNSFTLSILIFCLVLSCVAPLLRIQLLQCLVSFCSCIFFSRHIFFKCLHGGCISSLDITSGITCIRLAARGTGSYKSKYQR